jgi:hypothetical protein
MAYFIVHGYTVMDRWWLKLTFHGEPQEGEAQPAHVYLELDRPPWGPPDLQEAAETLGLLADFVVQELRPDPSRTAAANRDTPS